MGVAKDVTSRNNFFKPTLKYYSDTNEFDGEFSLSVPVAEDTLAMSFEDTGDSIRISGYFNLKSLPVKFYGDGRKMLAKGFFDCTLGKLNKLGY